MELVNFARPAQRNALEPFYGAPALQPVPSLWHTLRACYAGISVHLGTFHRIKSAAVIALYGLAVLPSQFRLRRESASGQRKNWTAEGLERLYLGCRDSLAFYNNYPVVFTDEDATTQPVDRAAKLINGMLLLRDAVARNALNGERDRYGTLDSHQLRRCFSTYRMARQHCDRLVIGHSAAHIVVMVRGHAYQLFLPEQTGGPTVEHPALAKALSEIIHDSQEIRTNSAKFSVGFMTALRREEWAKARAGLARATQNRRSLQALEESAFVVCLDLDSRPDGYGQAAAQIRIGNCENRFYDKSVQLIVFANGRAGINVEHAAIDGSVAVRVADYVQEYAANSGSNELLPRDTANGPSLRWEAVVFEPDEAQNSLADSAREQVANHLARREMTGAVLPDYGRSLWARHGISADAAVQLTIQLATYVYFRQIVSIFEPIHLRHFREGRIDFIAAVTPASREFVLNAAKEGCRGKGLRASFYEAVATHQGLIRNVKRGYGFVGHLLALGAVQYRNNPAKGQRVNAALQNLLIRFDKGVGLVLKQEIFAANGSAATGVAAFGTICTREDMLGIGYVIRDDCVVFDILAEGCYRAHCRQFVESLSKSVDVVRRAISERSLVCDFRKEGVAS